MYPSAVGATAARRKRQRYLLGENRSATAWKVQWSRLRSVTKAGSRCKCIVQFLRLAVHIAMQFTVGMAGGKGSTNAGRSTQRTQRQSALPQRIAVRLSHATHENRVTTNILLEYQTIPLPQHHNLTSSPTHKSTAECNRSRESSPVPFAPLGPSRTGFFGGICAVSVLATSSRRE